MRKTARIVLVMLLIVLLTAHTALADKLLMFTASWCIPCARAKKAIAGDPEFAARYRVELVDVKQDPEMAKNYNVSSVPTFVLLSDDGTQELARKVGYKDLDELKAWAEAAR